MCHILLFLPVLALPVFWLLPLPIAATLYLFTLLFSGWMYYVVLTVMHRPTRVGAETLLNRNARVIRTQGQRCIIRLGNELWSARSKGQLSPGDSVLVVSRDGLTLQVSPVTDKTCPRTRPSEAPACHGWLHRLRVGQFGKARTQDKSA